MTGKMVREADPEEMAKTVQQALTVFAKEVMLRIVAQHRQAPRGGTIIKKNVIPTNVALSSDTVSHVEVTLMEDNRKCLRLVFADRLYIALGKAAEAIIRWAESMLSTKIAKKQLPSFPRGVEVSVTEGRVIFQDGDLHLAY